MNWIYRKVNLLINFGIYFWNVSDKTRKGILRFLIKFVIHKLKKYFVGTS